MRRQTLQRILAIAALCSHPSAHADAENQEFFNYTVNSYPSSGESCSEAAAAMAERLADVTGVAVFRSYCEGEAAGTFDIGVTYSANEELRLVTTVDRQADDGGKGIYKSLADCNADLDGQKTIFEKETGLSAFVAYCYRQRFGSSHPIALRIDGFGEAVHSPQFFNGMFFGHPTDVAALESGVKKQLEEVFKVTPLRVVQKIDSIVQSKLAVQYYAEKPIPLRLVGGFVFADQSACADEEAGIVAMLAKGGFKPVQGFCSKEASLLKPEIFVLLTGRSAERIKNVRIESPYEDLGECKGDVARALELYGTENHDEILGGVCSFDADSSRYYVTIVTVPPKGT